MWKNRGEITISLKTDRNSIAGLISEAEKQMEELSRTIVRLKYCLSLEETVSPAAHTAAGEDNQLTREPKGK
ncbi:MAG: hypothetical protein HFG70_04920 [Hungatella sp.]|jgi:hypothetical protein|nr:hypothetical protein [Hungatella sp.]